MIFQKKKKKSKSAVEEFHAPTCCDDREGTTWFLGPAEVFIHVPNPYRIPQPDPVIQWVGIRVITYWIWAS